MFTVEQWDLVRRDRRNKRGWLNRSAVIAAMGLLSGCTAGGSASFTQAPLRLAEEAAPETPSEITPEPSAQPVLTALSGTTAYVASAGNALLPLGGNASAGTGRGSTASVTLNWASLVADGALVTTVSKTGDLVRTIAGTSQTVAANSALGSGALGLAPATASVTSSVAQTLDSVATILSPSIADPSGVKTVSLTVDAGAVAAQANALLAQPVVGALATVNALLPAVTAPTATLGQPTLLGTTVTSLVRCGLKLCTH